MQALPRSVLNDKPQRRASAMPASAEAHAGSASPQLGNIIGLHGRRGRAANDDDLVVMVND